MTAGVLAAVKVSLLDSGNIQMAVWRHFAAASRLGMRVVGMNNETPNLAD